MKKIKFLILAFFFILILNIKAQNTTGYQLFAHYPFLSNAVDITGNNPDTTIVNTTFSSDGIYSNGIYSGNDSSGAVIQSPNFSNFPANDYIITFDFKPELQDQHIIRFGGIWGQWLTISTGQGGKLFAVVRVSQNNTEMVGSSNQVIQTNTWYNLGITYKANINTFTFFINGNQIFNFSPSENPYYDNDFTFRNENGSTAESYKGYYKDFKIYKNASASIVNDFLENTFNISPNPCTSFFKFESEININSICIFDLQGKKVLETSNLDSNTIDVSKLNRGLYLVQFNKGNNQIVKKIIIK